MQGGKQIEMLHVFIAQALALGQIARNQTGVVGHALEMAAGFKVAQVGEFAGNLR